MKRLLALTLALGMMGMSASSLEAKPSTLSQDTFAAHASAQRERQRDRDWRDNDNRARARTVTRSRIVRFGRRVYRPTYQVRYFPNGRTNTRVISRVRIS